MSRSCPRRAHPQTSPSSSVSRASAARAAPQGSSQKKKTKTQQTTPKNHDSPENVVAVLGLVFGLGRCRRLDGRVRPGTALRAGTRGPSPGARRAPQVELLRRRAAQPCRGTVPEGRRTRRTRETLLSHPGPEDVLRHPGSHRKGFLFFIKNFFFVININKQLKIMGNFTIVID